MVCEVSIIGDGVGAVVCGVCSPRFKHHRSKGDPHSLRLPFGYDLLRWLVDGTIVTSMGD